MATHYDYINDDRPMITFFCEECQFSFEVEGRLIRADNDGGMDFIPGPNSISDSVFCPNDIAFEFGELPIHEISIEGNQ